MRTFSIVHLHVNTKLNTDKSQACTFKFVMFAKERFAVKLLKLLSTALFLCVSVSLQIKLT